VAAWDRQEDEPPKAYLHFTVYRDLGPIRTLDNTAKLRGVALPTLLELSAKWNWVARCDQWDAHVQAIHQRAYLTEVAKQARKRASAFEKLLEKSLEALGNVDVEKVPLEKVAAAMKTATEGIRLEEGLETSRVVMEQQDARFVLSRLPTEVRKPLLRALAEHALAGRPEGDSGGVPLGLDDGE
jgi:hypothetical protein